MFNRVSSLYQCPVFSHLLCLLPSLVEEIPEPQPGVLSRGLRWLDWSPSGDQRADRRDRADRLKYRKSIWRTKKKHHEVWMVIGSVRSCER